ncbi:hypothetical protein [Altererythrobacter aquiaggeris]|uniref:hypothetical protein n=1 Tax=Aestuarierythrobacter aquiaggeris TaxID=1898396 RepID=UPI00301A6B5E
MQIDAGPKIRGPRRPRKSLGERLRAALLELSGGHGTIERHTERSWASITFAGTRHTFDLSFDGSEAIEGGELLIAELTEHEFCIPGQLVADAAIISADHTVLPHPQIRVKFELLLLEDA